METVRALQEAMVMAKSEQEKLSASNEELRKANEELHKNLQQLDERSIREQGLIAQLRARPKPFSQMIMDAIIPANYITPKIVFTGVEDPESHLTVFNAQMIILGGTNAIHCKMFMGTFTSTNGHITSFFQFFELFMEQFIVNQG